MATFTKATPELIEKMEKRFGKERAHRMLGRTTHVISKLKHTAKIMRLVERIRKCGLAVACLCHDEFVSIRIQGVVMDRMSHEKAVSYFENWLAELA